MQEIFHKSFSSFDYWREILELSDGGEIALDWHRNPKTETKTRNIVILFPGVNGDSMNFYCKSVRRDCIARDYEFVVVNWRGMGGVPLKVSVFKHSNCVYFSLQAGITVMMSVILRRLWSISSASTA